MVPTIVKICNTMKDLWKKEIKKVQNVNNDKKDHKSDSDSVFNFLLNLSLNKCVLITFLIKLSLTNMILNKKLCQSELMMFEALESDNNCF